MKLNHKDLRFLLYEDRELKFFYAINVHSESMNQALLLLRDRMFSCQTPFFPFLGRNMVWRASLGFLQVHRALLHSPLAAPASPAPVHGFSWFRSSLHILRLVGVCDMLLRRCSVSVCLYTGALAGCTALTAAGAGLCRAGETMHRWEACVQR